MRYPPSSFGFEAGAAAGLHSFDVRHDLMFPSSLLSFL